MYGAMCGYIMYITVKEVYPGGDGVVVVLARIIGCKLRRNIIFICDGGWSQRSTT